MKKVNPEISLLILLMAAAAFVIFLPLGSVGLFDDERELLELARSYSNTGIDAPLSSPTGDFATASYAYTVSVGINVFRMPDILAVRLPSAICVWLLTVGIFRFRGISEKKSTAFLASLIFISSYYVSSAAYHASPVTLTALFLTAALASLYHWIKKKTSSRAYLLTASAACTTCFLGILSPVSLAVAGIIFLSIQEQKRPADYLKLLAILSAAALTAYFGAAFVANDPEKAGHLLGIGNLTEPLAEYSRLNMLALQLLFSIFPWSIPIIVALGWMACHPRWLKSRFLAMSLFKQFGVIVFILTLPFITALNGLSLIMMLTAIYFNAPLVSHFLLSQSHNHSVTWRITGGIFALLIAAFAIVYVCAMNGAQIAIFGHTMSPAEWQPGAILLLSAIAISLYTLSRNQRTIKFNNRYLYNIVILYILAQILYKTYINPYIAPIC